MEFIDRPATHSTPFQTRPILGGVLHSTQTDATCTTFQSKGGWHWQIDRDGTIYRDCDEDQGAWHVLGSDRWRPAWVVPCPGGATSDVNYCSVGIEIVSGPIAQAGATPYTDAQYLALAELVEDIESRYGPLPWVGHGELQRDRTDPVAFDWTRAGFGLNDGVNGHEYTPAETQEDPAVIAELEQKVAALSAQVGEISADRDTYSGALDACNRVKAEIETLARAAYVKSGRRYRRVTDADILAAVERAG